MSAAPDSGVGASQPDGIDQKTRTDQRLRKRRLGMSLISYLVTWSLVVFCWFQSMIPLLVVGQFLLFTAVISGVFWLLFETDYNLRFRDPSLTAPQMIVSVLPALWVMYFLDAGQARGAFLLITIVPLLYGILALNTRQFLLVGSCYFLFYGALLAALWLTKPEVLVGSLELFQLMALVLVTLEIAVIGGFIHNLRDKLRTRNAELKTAMTELSEAMAKIREMAHRDELTGVFNRRHLFDVLSREANRRRRANGPFSVCILDVDYFKQVNDQYGHQAGDEALRVVANSVCGSLRNIDCFGRYGGEEFLMVLPQTPRDGAMVKADRVRQAIQALRFPEIDGALRVTVSIGVAEHQLEEDADETIARADAALYRAKHRGRNQVCDTESTTA